MKITEKSVIIALLSILFCAIYFGDFSSVKEYAGIKTERLLKEKISSEENDRIQDIRNREVFLRRKLIYNRACSE